MKTMIALLESHKNLPSEAEEVLRKEGFRPLKDGGRDLGVWGKVVGNSTPQSGSLDYYVAIQYFPGWKNDPPSYNWSAGYIMQDADFDGRWNVYVPVYEDGDNWYVDTVEEAIAKALKLKNKPIPEPEYP